MKQFKVAFLFFISFFLVLFSCKTELKIESENSIKIDSINILKKKMRSNNFDLNTRLEFANEALQKSKKIDLKAETYKILVFKSYLFGLLKKYDSAVDISQELISISIENNDSIKTGKYYSRLAYYYQRSSKNDSAFFFYNLAKDFFLTIGDSINIGKNLAYIAIIQSDYGDYQESDKNAIKALTYLGDKNEKFLTAIYNCIAISSRKQNDFKEAIYWYNKALDISNDKFDRIEYMNNKANAFRYLKDFNKSIFLFNELLKDSTVNSKPKTKARIIDNLAYAKWLENSNTNVLPELLNALEIRQQENASGGLITSYSHLSEFYKKKDAKLSLEFANKMYELANQQKSPQDQLEALQKLIKLDNSSKVKEYYSSYIRINDSLEGAKSRVKNKFAKIKYDSEKNREDILQLKISNSRKDLAFQKEKTINIVGSISSGFVLVLFLVFIYNRSQKHKQDKRAEVYKTETRISKKIHDDVANNVVNIMNKVQYTEEPKEKLLDDLEKVYLLTRNISHQNKVVETGENYTASLKSLLTNFNSNTTTIILKNIQDVCLETLSETNQIEIYRILQELMVNMQKHSKAKLVALSFKKEGNDLSIQYSDNGVGVNLNTLEVKNGLLNMETRIKSINGIITFTSSLNKGFKAFISFK